MKATIKKRKLLILVVLSLVMASLFSAFPVDAARSSEDGMMLIPGGMTFGVQLQTKGVLVIGLSKINTVSGEICPAAESEIDISDIIYEVNGVPVNTVDGVVSLVNSSQGESITFSILRKGKKISKTLVPALSEDDGMYKAGIWIRDNTAGIGTVTFIDSEKKLFAGLGHGICDTDTGALMPLLKGRVCDVTVTGIKKGRSGVPGEIKGYFGATKTGSLIGNTPVGVYGCFSTLPESLMDPIPVAASDEIETGKAYIYSAVDNGEVNKYEIRIVRIVDKKRDSKNFVIEVTDEKLIEKTEGIVQGMSGSPIIQNGKLIGAVTHVMINNPRQGYGIFIENMLEKMPEFAA